MDESERREVVGDGTCFLSDLLDEMKRDTSAVKTFLNKPEDTARRMDGQDRDRSVIWAASV